MAQSRYCIRCRCADNGNGVWKKHTEWHDQFLTEAVENIAKYGEVRHMFCGKCEVEIKKKGHLIRKRGVE